MKLYDLGWQTAENNIKEIETVRQSLATTSTQKT